MLCLFKLHSTRLAHQTRSVNNALPTEKPFEPAFLLSLVSLLIRLSKPNVDIVTLSSLARHDLPLVNLQYLLDLAFLDTGPEPIE